MEKDRHILKYILAQLTSVEFLCSKGVDGKIFNRNALKANIADSKVTIREWLDKEEGMKPKETSMERKSGHRLKGAGRKFLAEKYPELTTLMLQLFDCAGDGLQSHPRLICDTLFLHNTKWMNMPRCVSILREVYDIDISVSAAYTYTENFREKSYQAKRHHADRNINPGMSEKTNKRWKS
jgi:hypothetical protein